MTVPVDAATGAPRLTVSVAMATYNGAAYLMQQLNSIARQTVLPDELVVTDDGSTDDTLALLDGFAATAPFQVRVVRNAQRLGYARNFRSAASLCSGDIIFFCDQDDIWTDDKIATMLAAFDDPATLLAYHGATVVDDADTPSYEFYLAEVELARLRTEPMDPWYSPNGLTQAFRSSLRIHDDLWDGCLNYLWVENEVVAHDQWYFFLAQVLGKVAYQERSLVRYRQHGANTVGAIKDMSRRGFRERWLSRMGHDPVKDRIRRAAATTRAATLRALSSRVAGRQATRVDLIARSYDALAARHGRRLVTYADPAWMRRLAALTSGVARGDYGGGAWRFARATVVRDLVGGVLRLGGGYIGEQTRRPAQAIAESVSPGA